ncbi:MAG: DUF488 domain-containing protein [Acidobacteriia bacterium]|nr:DUF488 domain-containing protein [Terriglobia bacterium]
MLTIGHSNRPLAEFLHILKAHGVEFLVDVRTVPRSRHNPQFNLDTLPLALEAERIGYRHMPGLGGLRHTRKDSPNTGWKNLSFRGYADYMQTEEFARSLELLLAVAPLAQAAIMCAESVPWRCHRSLIADTLTVRGVPVFHILSATKSQPHRLTPFARVESTSITYPSENIPVNS